MKAEHLREIMHTAPFKQFTIHVADGQPVRVPHPDFIALSGNGRLAIVVSPANESPTFRMIDVPLITQLEVEGVPRNGA
jgi:hypothetical protein